MYNIYLSGGLASLLALGIDIEIIKTKANFLVDKNKCLNLAFFVIVIIYNKAKILFYTLFLLFFLS